MKMNLYQLLQILNLSVNEFVQKVDKKAYKLWAKYYFFILVPCLKYFGYAPLITLKKSAL